MPVYCNIALETYEAVPQLNFILNIKVTYFQHYMLSVISSPEHGSAQDELLWSVNVHCPSCIVSLPSWVMRHAVSIIALKAYSSYTPESIDRNLSRKHPGDL